MKKILVLIGFCLLLVGCTGPTTYQTINFNRLESKLNTRESFVLVIGSATCPACATYRRTMEEIIREYRLMIYYVNYDDFNNVERSRLHERFDFSEGLGTPTTLFIINGNERLEDRIRGTAPTETIISLLEKHNFLEGES